MAASTLVCRSVDETYNNNYEKDSKNGGFLDLFWSLSSHDDRIREIAAFQLISCLIEEQNSHQEKEACPRLLSSLDRLVGGLSSTNKATRLGFYVALVELMKCFPDSLVLDKVFLLVDKHLSICVGSDKKFTNEAAIGRSLAYSALIRCGRISESTIVVKGVTEQLLHLFMQYDYLQELCGTLLLELVSQLGEIRFSKCVFPILNSLLSTGWQGCTPDTFRITLALSQRFPDTVDKKFLKQYWNRGHLFNTKSFDTVRKIMLKTTNTLPRVHPMCKDTITSLVGTPHYAEFWKAFSEAVLIQNQKENIFLLFAMLKESLKLVTSPDQIKDILNQTIVRLLMKCLSNEKVMPHGTAAELAKFLVDFVASSKSSQQQMEVLMPLLNFPGSIMFDQISGTSIVSGIVSHLHRDAIVLLIDWLKNIFLGFNAQQKQQSDADRKTQQVAALQKLANIVGLPKVKVDVGITTDVLMFLTLHSFFDQVGKSSEIVQCSMEPTAVSNDLHIGARDCFFKALSLLATIPKMKSANDPEISPLNYHCLLLNKVLLYIKLLLENPSTVKPVVPLAEKVQSTFAGIYDALAFLEKKGRREGQLPKSQAFQILFLHLGLQLFVDNERTIELIEDLHVCSKKAFEKFTSHRKRAASAADFCDGDPEWLQVVVDVLLSILSENSSLLRNVANMVFPLLVPQLSLAAFRQILEALSPNTDEDPDAADEDGTPESTTENSKHSGSSSDEDIEDEEEEEDDDDDDADTWPDNDDSNQSLRKSVEAALGDAASRSDAEEDESDLDDDAMMRIDESLAEAFKAIARKRPGVSKEDEALLHFRNRCLDLLHTVVNQRPTLDFVLESLPTLIAAVESGQGDKTQQPYRQRSMASIRHLLNIKKLQLEDTETLVNISDTLNAVIGKFKNVLDHRISQIFVQLCTFLVKCAIHIDRLPPALKKSVSVNCDIKSECVEVFTKSLKNFFENRACAIPLQMFTNLINKNMDIGWMLAEDVQKYVFSDNVKLFKKSQASSLLVTLTARPKQVLDILGIKRWETFSSSCISRGIQELNKMIALDKKQMNASNLLHLMCNCICTNKLAKVESQDMDELKVLLSSLTNKQDLSKFVRKPMNRLASLLNVKVQCNKRKHEEESLKSKKQKVEPEAAPKQKGKHKSKEGKHKKKKEGNNSEKE